MKFQVLIENEKGEVIEITEAYRLGAPAGSYYNLYLYEALDGSDSISLNDIYRRHLEIILDKLERAINCKFTNSFQAKFHILAVRFEILVRPDSALVELSVFHLDTLVKQRWDFGESILLLDAFYYFVDGVKREY